MNEITRRNLILSTAATIGGAAMAGIPKFQGQQGPYLALREEPIPTLPEKVKNTDSVGISMKTHEAHERLWQGYARKTNEIRQVLAQHAPDPSKANQIYSELRSLKVDYSFAYQGLINHNIYFDTIGGSGGPATGRIAELIRATYGSFENWAADWKATGIAGRGWVFLAYDHASGRVFNYLGDAQNTFPLWNHTCVLAMDVYEHAYFIDFAERRAAYIDAYMQTIDWEAVNARLP
jgi:Fe-Mn family superoxide dismutase